MESVFLVQRKFRYLYLDSVRSVVEKGKTVSLQDIVATLEFQVIGNPETRALEAIISRLFYEIVAIIAIISALAYLVMVSVITKPLRHLSHHIDAMRRGSDQLGESCRACWL